MNLVLAKNFSRYSLVAFVVGLIVIAVSFTLYSEAVHAQDRYELGQGDKVRVTVDRHPEISGDFTVGSDEIISIPFAGLLDVRGRTERDLEAVISSALANALRLSVTVNVELVERRPFFIVGDVKNPGAYAYVPGISVLKAVAIAGGLSSNSGTGGFFLESLRQGAQLHSDIIILKYRIAQQARLVAEYAGNEQASTPNELISLMGTGAANALMAKENEILAAQVKLLKEQLASADDMGQLKQEELDAYEQQRQQLQLQEQLISTELKSILDLQESGLVSRVRSFELRRDLGQIVSQKISITAVVARAKQDLSSALRSKLDISLRRDFELKQQIADIQQQIQEAKTRVKDSEEIYQTFETNSKSAKNELTVDYEILRRQETTNVTIIAGELSLVKAGDLVRVTRKSASWMNFIEDSPN
ncbi:MAG: polysaccharide biosynthesis/export family protein [Microcoleus sp.]